MENATAKRERPLPDAESEQIVPVPISKNDQSDIEKLYDAIRRGRAKLVGPNGESRSLPDSLYLFLVEVIGLLNEGHSIVIVQNDAKLTTAEAANMLGVSRQFLVNLLIKMEIPYHMVGTHRRIYAQDLFRYKAARDVARHRILRDLAVAETNDGTYYEDVPPSVDET